MNKIYADIDDIDSMFGMPDPDSDTTPMCDMPWCTASATHVAMDTDGESKVAVCEHDSHNTRWWGVWPIENDEDFGVPVGADGREIRGVESDRAAGIITMDEYRTNLGYAMAHMSNANRWRNPGKSGIVLDKPGDDVGGFVESDA